MTKKKPRRKQCPPGFNKNDPKANPVGGLFAIQPEIVHGVGRGGSAGRSLEPPDQADESQELTDVDDASNV